MKYAIVTFGCRVNQADSFQIEEQLIAGGGTHSSDVIFNILARRQRTAAVARSQARGT